MQTGEGVQRDAQRVAGGAWRGLWRVIEGCAERGVQRTHGGIGCHSNHIIKDDNRGF